MPENKSRRKGEKASRHSPGVQETDSAPKIPGFAELAKRLVPRVHPDLKAH
jgi:hypothetical protein